MFLSHHRLRRPTSCPVNHVGRFDHDVSRPLSSVLFVSSVSAISSGTDGEMQTGGRRAAGKETVRWPRLESSLVWTCRRLLGGRVRGQGINWLVKRPILHAQKQIVDCQPSKGASTRPRENKARGG